MTDPTSPAPPPSLPPNPRRLRRAFAILGLVLGGLLVIALIAAAFIRVPKVVISPGDAIPLDQQVVMVEGAPTYPHRGDVLFLTVSVSRDRPNVYRALYGWLHPDIDVYPEDQFRGKEPSADEKRLDITLMLQSQDVAKVVALQKLGYDASLTPDGGLVLVVDPDGEAHGEIRLGDRITAIDGTATPDSADVRRLIQTHQPGDVVPFTVVRADESRVVDVTLGEKQGVAYAGIVTRTDFRAEIPVDVEISTGPVQGPSAGLAFTLAIIDQMSPGDLTGGNFVAVTGEIFPDGSVGAIGGIRQKVLTAKSSGADFMIVPEGDLDEAKKAAGGFKVVGVATLDDALAALREAGGAPIVTTTTAARAA